MGGGLKRTLRGNGGGRLPGKHFDEEERAKTGLFLDGYRGFFKRRKKEDQKRKKNSAWKKGLNEVWTNHVMWKRGIEWSIAWVGRGELN